MLQTQWVWEVATSLHAPLYDSISNLSRPTLIKTNKIE